MPITSTYGPPPDSVTPEELHALTAEYVEHKRERSRASGDLGRATDTKAIRAAAQADEKLLGPAVRDGAKHPGTPNHDKLTKAAADAQERLDRHTAAVVSIQRELTTKLQEVAPEAADACRDGVADHLAAYEDALATLTDARARLMDCARGVAYWQRVHTGNGRHLNWGNTGGNLAQLTLNGRDIPLEPFATITTKLSADVTRITQTLELGEAKRPSTTVPGFDSRHGTRR